ncbi:hypothetical protein QU926_20815 [Pseudomonas asiatica]|uniref:hypothetical protein n=1 Tax=Pseudomonas asiatica TaxID=2219225 RepID=UPI0025AA7F57|nr:hypothetical protein [Pseudomonas asiatica]MDM9556059.1 hypothetical protein [Pseudomonas asiatica]
MPEIRPPPGQTTVRLPVLRSVVSGSRVLLQVAGSLMVPVGDTQGMYVGPDGYTEDIDQAQDFAPTISEEQVIVESPGAPGKSAYQLWLDNGNQGSYADYEAYNRGKPGVNPTPEQIAAAVGVYIAANPPAPGQDATPEQIALAVSAYLVQNPPKDGQNASQAQIADAVANYLAAHPVKDGQNATDAQVSQAVATYIAAHPPADGKSVEVQVSGGYIQARQTGGQWVNLIAVSSLAGTDGKSVELQKTATAIQWRQVGGNWADLVLLSAITGPSSKVSLGTVAVTQVANVALSAGIRSVTLTVQGVLKDDDILLFPTSALPAGYAIHNVVATAANTIVVTFFAPLLALGASFTISCRVVALR